MCPGLTKQGDAEARSFAAREVRQARDNLLALFLRQLIDAVDFLGPLKHELRHLRVQRLLRVRQCSLCLVSLFVFPSARALMLVRLVSLGCRVQGAGYSVWDVVCSVYRPGQAAVRWRDLRLGAMCGGSWRQVLVSRLLPVFVYKCTYYVLCMCVCVRMYVLRFANHVLVCM